MEVGREREGKLVREMDIKRCYGRKKTKPKRERTVAKKKRGKRKRKDERPKTTQEKKSHDLPPGRRSGIMPEGKEKTKSKQ